MGNYNVFEEIGKEKQVLGYVLKILLLLMCTSCFAFRSAFDFFKDFSDWESVFAGICIATFCAWCFIESFVGIIKMSNTDIIKKQERKKNNNGKK